MEIYGEDMRDLLDPVGSGNGEHGIHLRTLQNGQIAAVGCKTESVNSEEDMMRCLERGSMCRTTGSTLMNAHSSRSHAIFTLFLEQRQTIVNSNNNNNNQIKEEEEEEKNNNNNSNLLINNTNSSHSGGTIIKISFC